MTRVKRLDKECNITVLTLVSRNEFVCTVHDGQLCFHGHMLRKNALRISVPMRNTSWLMAQQDVAVLD